MERDRLRDAEYTGGRDIQLRDDGLGRWGLCADFGLIEAPLRGLDEPIARRR